MPFNLEQAVAASLVVELESDDRALDAGLRRAGEKVDKFAGRRVGAVKLDADGKPLEEAVVRSQRLLDRLEKAPRSPALTLDTSGFNTAAKGALDSLARLQGGAVSVQRQMLRDAAESGRALMRQAQDEARVLSKTDADAGRARLREAQDTTRGLLREAQDRGRLLLEIEKQNARQVAAVSRAASGEGLVRRGTALSSVGAGLRAAGQGMTYGYSVPALALGGYALKKAVSYEADFSNVRKTTGGTDAQAKVLRGQLEDLSTQVPQDWKTITNVASTVGQLGVARDQVRDVTRQIIELNVATKLPLETGTLNMVKFANSIGEPTKNIGRLGSVISELDKDSKATTGDVLAMALRLAGAGHAAGMSGPQILAFANAFAGVGVRAQQGGSAVSTAIGQIDRAVTKGGQSVANFAAVAGMSSAQFSKEFKENAAGAVAAFIEGLGKLRAKHIDLIPVLDALGLKNNLQRDAFLRASGAGDALSKALGRVDKAYADNTATTARYNKATDNTQTQLAELQHQADLTAVRLGEAMLPAMKSFLPDAVKLTHTVAGWVSEFEKLPAPVKQGALEFAAMTIAAGPLVSALGGAIQGFGTMTRGIGAFKLLRTASELGNIEGGALGLASAFPKVGAAAMAAEAAESTALAEGAAGLAAGGPWGLAVLAAAGLIGGIALAWKGAQDAQKDYYNATHGGNPLSDIKNDVAQRQKELAVLQNKGGWHSAKAAPQDIAVAQRNLASAQEYQRAIGHGNTGYFDAKIASYNAQMQPFLARQQSAATSTGRATHRDQEADAQVTRMQEIIARFTEYRKGAAQFTPAGRIAAAGGGSLPGYLRDMMVQVGQHVGYQCGEAVTKALHQNGVTQTATALLKMAQKNPSMQVRPGADGNYPAGTLLFFGDPSRVNQAGNHQHFGMAQGANGLLAENTTAGGGGYHYRTDESVGRVARNFGGRVFGFAPPGAGTGARPGAAGAGSPDPSLVMAPGLLTAATTRAYEATHTERQNERRRITEAYTQEVADAKGNARLIALAEQEKAGSLRKLHGEIETDWQQHLKRLNAPNADLRKSLAVDQGAIRDIRAGAYNPGLDAFTAEHAGASKALIAQAFNVSETRKALEASAQAARDGLKHIHDAYQDGLDKIALLSFPKDKRGAINEMGGLKNWKGLTDAQKTTALSQYTSTRQTGEAQSAAEKAQQTLADFHDSMTGRVAAAKASVLGDDKGAAWDKATSGSKELAAALAKGGQAAKDARRDFDSAFDAEKVARMALAVKGFDSQMGHDASALRLQLSGAGEVQVKWQEYLAANKDFADKLKDDAGAAGQAFSTFSQNFSNSKLIEFNTQMGQARQQLLIASARTPGAAWDAAHMQVQGDGSLRSPYIPAQSAALKAAEEAIKKAEEFKSKMAEVNKGLTGMFADTFTRILSGEKVTFGGMLKDFKGMVIKMVAEAEAQKVASFVMGAANGAFGSLFGGDPAKKKGKGGLSATLPAGTKADPTYVSIVEGAFGIGGAPGAGSFGIGGAAAPGFSTGGAFGGGAPAPSGGGFMSVVSTGLALYAQSKGGGAGTNGFPGTPGIAPGAGSGGGTDWLGTAASMAPMMGPQGAAIGAGLSILDMFTHKKKAAAPSGIGAGAGGGPIPVYIVGMAQGAGAMPGGIGGPGGAGAPGQGGSALGGILGIASAFMPALGGLKKIFHFAQGGIVPGQGNADSVPAMLMPREVVLSQAMLAGTAPPPSLPPSFITNVQHAAPASLSKADLTDAFRAALAGSDSSKGVSIGSVTQTNHYSTPSGNGSEDLATTLRQRLG